MLAAKAKDIAIINKMFHAEYKTFSKLIRAHTYKLQDLVLNKIEFVCYFYPELSDKKIKSMKFFDEIYKKYGLTYELYHLYEQQYPDVYFKYPEIAEKVKHWKNTKRSTQFAPLI